MNTPMAKKNKTRIIFKAVFFKFIHLNRLTVLIYNSLIFINFENLKKVAGSVNL